MAVFEKVSGRLAPPDAIGNELFKWLTTPKVTKKRCLGIATAGLLPFSLMANVLADRPKESGQVVVRSRVGDGRGDMSNFDGSSGATSPMCLYTIYRLLQIS